MTRIWKRSSAVPFFFLAILVPIGCDVLYPSTFPKRIQYAFANSARDSEEYSWNIGRDTTPRRWLKKHPRDSQINWSLTNGNCESFQARCHRGIWDVGCGSLICGILNTETVICITDIIIIYRERDREYNYSLEFTAFLRNFYISI